jgi:hypothetical protein
MKERRITFETARLAKEKEFGYDFNKQLPEYVPMFYCESDNDDNLDLTTLEESECQGEDIVRCDFYFRSTQSLLQKWLREVHGIDCLLMLNMSNEYSCHIYKNKLSINQHKDIWNGEGIIPSGRDYDKVLEEGLQEALKLINDER